MMKMHQASWQHQWLLSVPCLPRYFSGHPLAGSFTLYLQTYAIVGLGWDKSDASYLNAICAAGQIIGRLVGILLSEIRQPKTSTVNCCIAGSRRRWSVADDDGGLVECRARCRNESRRVRCW
jgi:hypothetical protein